ncbi:MAG: L-threonylcarbamoyladenylate synthase [Candidatus Bathyarchaeia archaeon]
MSRQENLDVKIKEAATVVKRGGVIIYPTDTVYGIGCDPFNSNAVRKLFKIKGRGPRPVPILVSNFRDAKSIADFSRLAVKIAMNYWPGPLTLVLPERGKLPAIVCSDEATVGLRIPQNPLTLKLIMLSGGYLVGTSANKSGHKPARTAEEAVADLSEVDYVLDGGPTELGIESTILDISTEEPKILRLGAVKISLDENRLS